VSELRHERKTVGMKNQRLNNTGNIIEIRSHQVKEKYKHLKKNLKKEKIRKKKKKKKPIDKKSSFQIQIQKPYKLEISNSQQTSENVCVCVCGLFSCEICLFFQRTQTSVKRKDVGKKEKTKRKEHWWIRQERRKTIKTDKKFLMSSFQE
jgi:hypothetical protein